MNIFISGGSSGLGFELVKHYLELDHQVFTCARNIKNSNFIEKMEGKFRDKLGNLRFEDCDISNSDSVNELFSSSKFNFSLFDVVICNAGTIGPIDKFLDSEIEAWKDSFNINLYGVLNLATELLPDMLSKKRGRFIHISGGGATSPLPGMTSYAASKAAAVRFVETLAHEYRDKGITFNSIAPGMLKTRLLDEMLNAGEERIGIKLMEKSMQKKGEISDSTSAAIELIDFLISPFASQISGKLISAEWDNWNEWPNHTKELTESDLYTLRRITGRDRNASWGDK